MPVRLDTVDRALGQVDPWGVGSHHDHEEGEEGDDGLHDDGRSDDE